VLWHRREVVAVGETPSPVALRERVAGVPVARLATVRPDGRPHIVPICFALAEQVLYTAIDQKPKRSSRLVRLENVEANPRVAVLVDHYDDDWSRLWWVRLDGRARVLADGAERTRALALLADRYPQYSREAPAGPVIAIDVRTWHSWAFDPATFARGDA
jgi:PPOX class probable F420-dependent enzyme